MAVEPLYTRLPLFLKEWRTFCGMTQDNLMAATGIPKSTISELERRLIPISERHLEKLADAFDCEPIDILTWDPHEGETLARKALRIPPEKVVEVGRILDIMIDSDQRSYTNGDGNKKQTAAQ